MALWKTPLISKSMLENCFLKFLQILYKYCILCMYNYIVQVYCASALVVPFITRRKFAFHLLAKVWLNTTY